MEMLEETLKVSLLQIVLNNRLLYILHQSIKVSLIAVSLEQLIYLFLTRFCLLSIPPRTLQRHPCPLGRQNYLNEDGCWLRVLVVVQQTDTGCLTVLEKNGLRLVTDTFENYRIDSQTDLFVLDQDDFSKLVSRGLKPLHVKKLERWCDVVCERVENMLPSSLNTPTAEVLSSEELNVVTPAVHSVAAAESVSENEIEPEGLIGVFIGTQTFSVPTSSC